MKYKGIPQLNVQTKRPSTLKDVQLVVTEDYFHLAFATPTLSLSSAVYNGGVQLIDNFVNLKVEENFNGEKTTFPNPELTIDEFFMKQSIVGNNSGMMTAASMNSFRQASVTRKGVTVACFLTCGLSNARCAGDPADWPYFDDSTPPVGTINIVLGTSALLSEAAMVETIMIVTEAKAAILTEMKIQSIISNRIATGTGTDSVLVFCRNGTPVKYCGKHVLFGEMVAETVGNALRDSLKFYTLLP